jgi:hypothetical protein
MDVAGGFLERYRARGLRNRAVLLEGGRRGATPNFEAGRGTVDPGKALWTVATQMVRWIECRLGALAFSMVGPTIVL